MKSEIISLTFGALMTALDDEVVRAVQKVGIDVNKEELVKALELYHNLVRCKECKYEPICSHSVQHTAHEPTTVTIGYKSVDYCSYGERKGE